MFVGAAEKTFEGLTGQIAQGMTSGLGELSEALNQTPGQLDRKDNFLLGHGQQGICALRFLHITVGLTTGNAITFDQLDNNLMAGRKLLQERNGQVDAMVSFGG